MSDRCASAEELQRYLEHMLDEPERRAFEDHVAGCSLCATTLARLVASAVSDGEVPRPALRPGDRVDRYELIAPLGAGAMGVVWRVRDPRLERQVALKVLRPGLGIEHAERLIREARLLARLAHPNVVAVHDAGESEGRVYLAMEHVAGRTLHAWLDERERTWSEIVDAFRQAGRGLEAAHRAGVVHRDVKPDNILYGDDGRVRVADFGLASGETAIAGSAASASSTSRPGTPAFMAPERVAGGRADERSDTWSFARALWWSLFGATPPGGAPKGRVPARIVRALRASLADDPARRAPLSSLLAALEPRAALGWVAIGLGVAVVAVSAVLITRATGVPAPTCRAQADALAGIWDDAARSSVGRALSGAPWSASRATVERTLDAYAARWVTSRERACTAARIEGLETEAIYETRLRCLDARRVQLRATVDALMLPDNALGAVSAVGALPPIDDCDSLAYVTAALPPPATTADAAALEAELARAQALFEAGAVSAVRALVGTLTERARVIGYAPLVARAELLSARAQVSDAPREAVTLLKRAASAAEGAGADALLLEIRLRLASVLGWTLSEIDAADEWADLAAAVAKRLGDPPDAVARIARARADIRFKARDLEAALVAHRANLDYWQRRAPDGVMVAEVTNQIAIDLAELGRLDEAKAQFERAHALQVALRGAAHPKAVDLVGNLAQLERMLGHTAAALELNAEVLRLREEALGPHDGAVAAALHNRMLMLLDAQRFDEAWQAGTRALSIFEPQVGRGHVSLISTLQNAAESAARSGHGPEARALAERAVAIARGAGEHHPELGRSLYFAALVVEVLDGCAGARAGFDAAVAEFDAAGGGPDPRAAFALDGAARCALAAEDRPVAERLFRRSIALREATLGNDHPFLTDSLLGLAQAIAIDPTRRAEAVAAIDRGVELARRIERQDIVDAFEKARVDLRLTSDGAPSRAP